MQSKEILKNVIHLSFDTQYEVTSTMLRVQEFYESPYPEIKDQIFTLQDYIDLYTENKGNFTYYEDWSGFNIPGEYVSKFFRNFIHLSNKEKQIHEVVKPYISSGEKYYLIASCEGDESVLDHEIAHALWYLDEDYKKEVSEYVKNNFPESVLSIFKKELLEKGYCEEVLDDEIQAYLTTSEPSYLEAWDFYNMCDPHSLSIIRLFFVDYRKSKNTKMTIEELIEIAKTQSATPEGIAAFQDRINKREAEFKKEYLSQLPDAEGYEKSYGPN